MSTSTENRQDLGIDAEAREDVMYHVTLGGPHYPIRELSGVEAISQPVRFEALFRTPFDELFDPDGMPGRQAGLAITRGPFDQRHLSLVVTEVAIEASVSGESEVRLVLEPAFALLRHKSDARVFVDQTVREIVTRVLTDGMVKHDFRLRDAYATRPYTVQIDETDFDFVTRLLEDEGIFYVFLEDADGTMVLADHASAYAPVDGELDLPFKPAAGLDHGGEGVHEIGRRAKLAPSTVSLRDFNPEHPDLDMDVHAEGPCAAGAEFYDYPGKFALPNEGAAKARRMSEALACAANLVMGASSSARLAPGRVVRLVDAPGFDDAEIVMTRVEHAYHLGEKSFGNRFEALESTVTFRPERVTPSPVVTGVLTGTVTGPAGSDIHTDPLGRVKVRFPWDRRLAHDDTCSSWIPTVQDNTGHSAGIPRVGWEVLVAFVEGDPDRPVVLGRVYNGADKFPEPLPDNKTVSNLMSLSSPTRTGSNMIRFEDKAGSEQIFMQSQKDQSIAIANDKTEKVGRNEFNTVSGNETVAIGADHTATVGSDRSMTVSGDQSIEVVGSVSLDVGQEHKIDVAQNRTLSIAGSHTRTADSYDALSMKTLTEKVGAVDLEASIKSNSTSAGMLGTLSVGGAVVELTLGGKSETCKLIRIETVGGLVFTKAGVDITTSALSRMTNIGGMLSVTAAGALTLKSGTALTADAMLGEIDASTSLTLKAGGSIVVLKDGNIAVTTDKKIQLEARGTSHLGASVASLNKG